MSDEFLLYFGSNPLFDVQLALSPIAQISFLFYCFLCCPGIFGLRLYHLLIFGILTCALGVISQNYCLLKRRSINSQ
jgi:hypothetical protein